MTQTDTAVEYTRDELIDLIDKCARRVLGMSAHELAVAYKSGTLEMPTRAADLIALLNLFPDNDPLFEAK